MKILELKNTVSEMKNSLDSLNKMLDMRIKKFCELSDNSTESRLHCTALHRYCASYKLKFCGNPVLSKSIGAIFPTAFPHSMSLSHFGNSHNILKFPIIGIFVVVICDQ